MITGAIYYWQNKTTGKVYIGSSSAPHKRFFDHINRSTNKELRDDFAKYGLAGFSFGILEFIEFVFSTPKEEMREALWAKEQEYVNKYLVEGNKLIDLAYNIYTSVRGLGKTFSDEQRKKMSDGGKGKVLSEEHKRKISKNHISKKAGYTNHFKGKRLSDEHRKAVSDGLRGKKIRVAKYNRDGCLLATYNSLSAAASENGFQDATNISKCLSGKLLSYKGYIWIKCEAGKEPNVLIEVEKKPEIIMFDHNLKEVGRYKNTFHVEKEVGINHTTVKSAIDTKNPTRIGSYYFEYAK